MKYRAPYLEVMELAAELLGLDLDKMEDVDSELDEAIYEAWGIEGSEFHKLINLLVPRIMIGQSPLTKTWYKGFTSQHEPCWLVKMEIDAPKLEK